MSRLPIIRNLGGRSREAGMYPVGHYHSPIPDSDDISRALGRRPKAGKPIPGIDLNLEAQIDTLRGYEKYYRDLPFPEDQHPDYRYYFNQSWFCYADAIFLYCFLRSFRPSRVVEVGSGFSSAVMLDTNEHFLDGTLDLTFIEPNPERLHSTLREQDAKSVRIVPQIVQDVPLAQFESLTPGDLLFIDSSHVAKAGSDLLYLLFEVIPTLPSGVFVHIHDIFDGFEYPGQWLQQGRYWNECYFIRAFLANNASWRIFFFNHYLAGACTDYLAEHFPKCLLNPGGSLYLLKN